MLKDITNSNSNTTGGHPGSPLHLEKPFKAVPDATRVSLPLLQASIPTAAHPVVLPIPPSEVATKLTRITEGLRQLLQGMSAWIAMREPMANSAELEAVHPQLREVESLLAQARALHRLQGPFATSKAPSPQAPGGQIGPEETTQAAERPLIVIGGSRRGLAPPSRRRLSESKFSYGRISWPPTVSRRIVVVEFKRQRLKRCLSEVAMDPGTYVIVPGDRGYDCGLVVQCGVWNPALDGFEEDTLRTMDDNPISITRMKGDVVTVLREATTEEVHQLYGEQATKERLALKTCRELVQKLELDMTVVDCEYQFDGTKISFYFEASHSIDFRDLNRELFRIFNARIWMENVNNCVKNVIPEGAMSKSDKIQYQSSGLRLPPH
ncbi:unnamed protein product [Phytomonas sp. Hart1]|nr:unnamed protein product [Phytomonas sp. Hart1]|eukprot:CCW70638.1 unnamed protein product [Phytomonas sp. isolate Hart1]